MEIVWGEKAEIQLQGIIDYYAKLSALKMAETLNEKINRTVIQLQTFPNMGRIEPNLKETLPSYRSILAYPNYKVIYRVGEDVIYIAGIWDCRQDPQRMLEEITLPSERIPGLPNTHEERIESLRRAEEEPDSWLMGHEDFKKEIDTW